MELPFAIYQSNLFYEYLTVSYYTHSNPQKEGVIVCYINYVPTYLPPLFLLLVNNNFV